ncbi:hypothetical protein V6615_07365 [Oscillospiraceae bacterium PP1C4]
MNYKLPKTIFIFSSIACVALRIFLKLSAVDSFTGFYEGDTLTVIIFNILLGAAIIAMFALGLLAKPTAHTMNYRLPSRILAMLTGISALVFSSTNLFSQISEFTNFSASLNLASLVFNLIGVASGVVFLNLGFRMHSDSAGYRANGVLLLLPLLWQVYVLLTSFMSYTAIRSVSDQLLATLMLISLVPFLLAHGRILAGADTNRGIRHLVAFGLPFSLLALTTSIGTIAAALAGKPLEIALSFTGAVFYLVTGLYAASCIFSLSDQAPISAE